MNISLSLNQEQTDALTGVLAGINAQRAAATPPQEPLTAEDYLALVLMKAVDSYVATAYQNAVKRLGDAAAQLPYAERTALIAQVESSLSQP